MLATTETQSASDLFVAYPKMLPESWDAVRNPEPLLKATAILVDYINGGGNDSPDTFRERNWTVEKNPDMQKLSTEGRVVVAMADMEGNSTGGPQGGHPIWSAFPTIALETLTEGTPWVYFRKMWFRNRDLTEITEHTGRLNRKEVPILLDKGYPINVDELALTDNLSPIHMQKAEEYALSLDASVYDPKGDSLMRKAELEDYRKSGVLMKVYGNVRLYLGINET